MEETPVASAVGRIMKEVVDEAAKTGMTENIWKELENDIDILNRMVQKIEGRNNTRRLEKAVEERKTGLR